MHIDRQEAAILIRALDSYIRRKIRDYNHSERQGVDIEQLQRDQARIERAHELRDRILTEGLKK